MEELIFEIILEIIAEKVKTCRRPLNALRLEVMKRLRERTASIEGTMKAIDLLIENKKIEAHSTINDTAYTIKL